MRDFSHLYQLDPSPVPTAWERFLAEEGILESRCPSLLQCETREGLALRSWVLSNYKIRYVPELVIQTLGLHQEFISSSEVDQ